MGAALRKVLKAPDLQQHGSNITAQRLRFDFNHDKLTSEEKQAVEDQVNAWIDADLPVSFAVYPTDEALKMGAIGAFGERYGDKVKVYSIGEGDNVVSFEVCGGPHVEHTGVLPGNTGMSVFGVFFIYVAHRGFVSGLDMLMLDPQMRMPRAFSASTKRVSSRAMRG